jgi:hypothetical protein
MNHFGLTQNSYLETIAKTLIYRLYATLLTISISYFVFGIDSILLLLSFATADIISGLTTYYTFENLWIWLNSFKPIPKPNTKPINKK